MWILPSLTHTDLIENIFIPEVMVQFQIRGTGHTLVHCPDHIRAAHTHTHTVKQTSSPFIKNLQYIKYHHFLSSIDFWLISQATLLTFAKHFVELVNKHSQDPPTSSDQSQISSYTRHWLIQKHILEEHFLFILLKRNITVSQTFS